MTVSMRKMSAGKGFEYLLRSVAAGDGNRALTTPLTRYYAEAGTPPGRWMGSGLGEFGQGQIVEDSVVTQSQLALLLGMGRDPVTGDQLGRAYQEFPTVPQRIAKRIEGIEPGLSEAECELEITKIEKEENRKGPQSAVAGFDFTFSVPKSVSVLWGVVDAGTQALIVEAHHEAVAQVVAFLEREVALTRAGSNARNGAVAQHEILGIAAAAYDHWDSRAGDPQLHTHVVISNKVRTAYDRRWRSLDSIPIHRCVVAISEHYNAVLADTLTRTFGVQWDRRERGKDRRRALEVTGVPEELVSEFSNRSRAIDIETDRLIEKYVADHGRRPSKRVIVELRAEATLATREEKHVHSLADLTAGWRNRASRLLGAEATQWARTITLNAARPPMLRADDVPLDLIVEVGSSVVEQVSEKRSTWRHWNLWAEASRQTMEWRFASVQDREAVVGMVVDAATRASLSLTPPELALSPAVFRREDGSSRFRPRHSTVFSSADLLAAEDRLLARANNTKAATVDLEVVEEVTNQEVLGHLLSSEQAQTLATIAVSGRQVDLLIGPAGAGKTTAMRALHAAWTAAHGKDSVIGLAPSAAAAQVLAEDLGVECDNTAKWLHEYDRGRITFGNDQLVIIDEATLAGTLTLDRLTGLAADAGAKVLLVGDWAQLQSVEAGGAFALLAASREDTPELTEVRRFTNEWEKAASLDLRFGRTEGIATYLHHDRVREGTTAEMIDAAYVAWRSDLRAGLASILVTEATQSVIDLNQRARAERIFDGETAAGREVDLVDGTQASAGDLIITRSNDRRIRSLRGGWVRNGDRWRITDVLGDGAIVVRRLGRRLGATVVLPAGYVADHVDLGYAITAHRAQGITVDTAHVVASGATTRENFYVSMTRGRDSNIAYVALDKPDDSHAAPQPDDVNARTVLFGILQHSGLELSAHQTIEAEQEQWSSISQIGAEYETVAAAAQYDRWVALLHNCGLDDEQGEEVIASDSFGPLTAELRRAEANHHDVDTMLPRLVASRPLGDAADIGAVLISRLSHATSQPKGGRNRRVPKLIVGLIPVADGPTFDEMRAGLAERETLMEARALAIVEDAVSKSAPWLRRLGQPPARPTARDRWIHEARTVAAYRDRYGIDDKRALGPEPTTDTQRLDRARASAAIRRADAILSLIHI